ncbi:MAG: aspartate dehydrogenase [Pseudomonadota bacterium]
MPGIGIIGYGGIARTAIELVEGEKSGPIVGVLVRPGREDTVPKALNPVTTIDDLIDLDPHIIAECAGQPAVGEYGPAILAAGIDLLAISIGALADPSVETALRDAAEKGGSQIRLPPGAIGAIDALAAMKLAGLNRVAYRSRKPPRAWAKDTDDEAITERTVLYRGTAREAALRYPKNANVAATVALAGLGLDETMVELVADPDAPGNVHEIEAEGPSGRFSIELEGRPSPQNPKTSALTALSVARALINRKATFQV